MSVQYQTVVDWDINLRDATFLDTDTLPTALQGLCIGGVYIVTGSPTATANKYAPGAIINNVIDGEAYINDGSSASPTFKLITHA